MSEKEQFKNSQNENENISSLESESDITAIADETGTVLITMPNISSNDNQCDVSLNNEDIKELLQPAVKINEKPENAEFKAQIKGIKIFAIILSIIILFVSAFAGGYFLGYNTSNSNTIQEKPIENELSVAEVYSRINKSVVGIIVYNSAENTVVSNGLIYSKNGYIITTDNIYASITNPKFLVITSDRKQYNADYIAGDLRSNIAVLKINAVNLTPVTFGNSDKVNVGEKVAAIAKSTDIKKPSNITTGVVSAVNIRIQNNSSYTEKVIQADAPVNPGNIGGALCNMYGQVIGLISSNEVSTGYEGTSYSIPSQKIINIADSLIKNKYVKDRVKLGITYREIDDITAKLSNTKSGLLVASVDKSSSLYGKVNENDIIIKINNTDITSSEIVLDVLEKSTPRDTISLTIYTADKKIKTITVTLLEDKGSSSYKKSSNNSSSSSSNSSEYTTSEFNFPDIN